MAYYNKTGVYKLGQFEYHIEYSIFISSGGLVIMDKDIKLGKVVLTENYGARLGKYTSGKVLDTLREHLEGVLSFGFTTVFPVILSGIIALGLSILFGFLYKSLVFGILFFVFTIPVFLIGIGALGLAKAVQDFAEGINFILCYAINVVKEIKQIYRMERQQDITTMEVTEIALKQVVLPVVKNIIARSFLGEIVYLLVRIITLNCMKAILKAFKDEFDGEDNVNDMDGDLLKVSNKTFQMVNNVTMKTVRGVVILLRVIGILSIIAGSFLIFLLFIVHWFAKF
jgi:hypothetical protein